LVAKKEVFQCYDNLPWSLASLKKGVGSEMAFEVSGKGGERGQPSSFNMYVLHKRVKGR
jgi:hypothetical protein